MSKKPLPKLMTAEDFLARKIKPPEFVLDPWLPRFGAAEIHGPRGTGKTHVVLGIAVAIATGKAFLRWDAPKPRRVLLIDGEMPLGLLQEWLREAKAAAGVKRLPKRFGLVADGFGNDRLPRLSDPEALRGFYTPLVAEFDVILLDNISSLCGRAGDMWSDLLQGWILELRRKGKTVCFLHHSGKAGLQRGTSHKEDNLHSVLSLAVPQDYDASQGCRFLIQFEKHRGFWGEAAAPFEAQLVNGRWSMQAAVSPLEKIKGKICDALKKNGPCTTNDLYRTVANVKAVKLRQALADLEAEEMIEVERFGRKGRLWFLREPHLNS